jgi:DNA-binding PadR family transcriptional regulator
MGRDWGGRGGMRRGEIRPLILAVLATKPMHGYEVITELEAQSGGRWRPSAGSVYPPLQQLADEGLLTSQDVEGRRVYTLTAEGKAAAEAAPLPRRWADKAPGEADPRQAVMQLMGAVMQVQRVGSPAARDRSVEILNDARREVYRLLAEDDAGTTEPAAPPDQSSAD